MKILCWIGLHQNENKFDRFECIECGKITPMPWIEKEK